MIVFGKTHVLFMGAVSGIDCNIRGIRHIDLVYIDCSINIRMTTVSFRCTTLAGRIIRRGCLGSLGIRHSGQFIPYPHTCDNQSSAYSGIKNEVSYFLSYFPLMQ